MTTESSQTSQKYPFHLPGSSPQKVGEAGPDMAADFTLHCVDAWSPGGSSGCVFSNGGGKQG